MQVFADDGACIDARVDGRDRRNAVVLIHGFPLTRAIWDAQADVLARTLARDSSGLARRRKIRARRKVRTSWNGSPRTSPRCSTRSAIERVALVGHSMGGYVALAFARMFTERVTRLALVASRLRADTPDEASARRTLAERVERERSTEAVSRRIFAASARAAHFCGARRRRGTSLRHRARKHAGGSGGDAARHGAAFAGGGYRRRSAGAGVVRRRRTGSRRGTRRSARRSSQRFLVPD